MEDNTDNCFNTTRCDTEKYTVDVNALDICGETGNDWRLPERAELEYLTLVDGITSTAIDLGYFPNTVAGNTWSATSSAEFPAWALHLNFVPAGNEDVEHKTNSFSVRLVRGVQ